MSKELQEKAEKMIQELQEALIPIREELKTLSKTDSGKNGHRI